jgi:cytochrome c oxidase cbb3-type subunit 3
MSDFTSDFWSIYIAALTLASIVGCAVFLKLCGVRRVPGQSVDTTGHRWDENLQEWNNPLPRWWVWMFYLTVAFSLGYLALYPGLGSFGGQWAWTSAKQYEDEMKQAQADYGPIFDRYLKQDLKHVAADPAARGIGERLFLNHCAQCHGSDAGGTRGFPSLKAGAWTYGGEPETIKTTIMDGRNGVMPPMAAAVGNAEDVKDVAHHVLSLSGRTHDGLRAQRGKPKFETVCAACHGPAGKGNPALGAPNLADAVWVYGGTEAAIVEGITNGRNGVMPAHKDLLGEAKVHLLAAYVYGLSAAPGAGK